MTAALLHETLMDACKNGKVSEVQQLLESGAEPNFNINRQSNALDTAIEVNNHQIVTLLVEHGAIVKEFVIQKAIEKDRDYLNLVIPDFKACGDKSILIGVLQAAINIGDLELAQQAIEQGAQPASLFVSSILNLPNTDILALLIENGFNIHADKNMILTQWMGATLISGWRKGKHERHDLLAFISNYYIDKPESIIKFTSLRLTDKSLLFRIGLSNNNINMMKFSLLIGVDKNEALNAVLYRYYIDKDENVDYEIIEYLLNSNIEFKKITITNAVSFNYTALLNALSRSHDLECAYEIAYKSQKDDLLTYFNDRGVSNEAQSFIKMKVSAMTGNIKELRNAINNGANIKALDSNVIVEIINENQVKSLKYLYEAGLHFDFSLNQYLDQAMRQYKAYESISYLIELGFDISYIKNIPAEYKQKYPAFADMKEKRFSNIFKYTLYLAKEVYPKAEGKNKEKILKRVAELSSLPYVIEMSKKKSLEK